MTARSLLMLKKWRDKWVSTELVPESMLPDIYENVRSPIIITHAPAWTGASPMTLAEALRRYKPFNTGDVVHWRPTKWVAGGCRSAVVVNESIWLDCDTQGVVYPFLDETSHSAKWCNG